MRQEGHLPTPEARTGSENVLRRLPAADLMRRRSGFREAFRGRGRRNRYTASKRVLTSDESLIVVMDRGTEAPFLDAPIPIRRRRSQNNIERMEQPPCPTRNESHCGRP